jgi:hypothetical protein
MCQQVTLTAALKHAGRVEWGDRPEWPRLGQRAGYVAQFGCSGRRQLQGWRPGTFEAPIDKVRLPW